MHDCRNAKCKIVCSRTSQTFANELLLLCAAMAAGGSCEKWRGQSFCDCYGIGVAWCMEELQDGAPSAIVYDAVACIPMRKVEGGIIEHRY